MSTLKDLEYERFSIAPGISEYSRGIRTEVYFTNGVITHHAYGENGKIHGYIAPVKYITNHDAIKRMIGYSGKIVIIDRGGMEYVGYHRAGRA